MEKQYQTLLLIILILKASSQPARNLNLLGCVRLACQPTSQQYYSLVLNQYQLPATSQSTVLFSHNKSALVISHSQANTTICMLFSL